MSENQSECVHNWASCINLNISNVDISGSDSGIRTFEIVLNSSDRVERQVKSFGTYCQASFGQQLVPHHCDPTYLAEDIWCRQQFIQVFNKAYPDFQLTSPRKKRKSR